MIRTMTARPAGDEIWIEGPNLKGQPLRWIFLQITSHSFHWSNFVSEDGGQTWCFQEEADHLPSLREPDAYGAPQSSDSDDTPGRHATHPQSVSLSQSSLFTLSSTNATGGRREVGTAARGVWAGCGCFDRDAALPTAAQYPPDP